MYRGAGAPSPGLGRYQRWILSVLSPSSGRRDANAEPQLATISSNTLFARHRLTEPCTPYNHRLFLRTGPVGLTAEFQDADASATLDRRRSRNQRLHRPLRCELSGFRRLRLAVRRVLTFRPSPFQVFLFDCDGNCTSWRLPVGCTLLTGRAGGFRRALVGRPPLRGHRRDTGNAEISRLATVFPGVARSPLSLSLSLSW